MQGWLSILLLAILGVGFGVGSIVASTLLAPSKPSPEKLAPYECGMPAVSDARERHPIKFYLVAMIFVVVDIEVIFLFPWAVDSQSLGRFGLVEILVFAASVFVPFIYLVANGALDWGPIKRVRPVESQPDRTSSSTVRHVGPPNDQAA